MSARTPETVRLEEWTGGLQGKLVAVWQASDTAGPWLPTEFMLGAYVTRILVAGRSAATSIALAADPSWTQIWRAPGGREWSCLLGLLQHMPGPILLVIGPDMALSARLVEQLQGVRGLPAGATVVVLRGTGAPGWVGPAADQLFLPVMSGAGAGASLATVLNEWAGRTTPRGLDTKTLLPQLAAQGYGLTAADGAWHWYRPADSTGFATLTVAQIARQLQILGSVLERAAI
jgi:hypothetical protein